MNNIITQKRLVELIASTAQCTPDAAQAFIVAFTNEIKDALVRDKSTKIKDLGEFMVTSDSRIIFVPDSHLAEAINAPFAMFEPEVLAPGITSDELNKPVAKVVVPEATAAPVSPVAPAEPTPATPEVPVAPADPVTQSAPALPEAAPDPAPSAIPEPAPAAIPVPAPSYLSSDTAAPEEDDSYPQESSSDGGSGFPTFMVLIGLLVGLILGCGIGFFLHDPIQEMLEPSLAEVTDEEQLSDADLAILDIFSEDSTQETASTENAEAKAPEAKAPETKAPETKPAASTTQATKPTAATSSKADVYDTVTTNLAALSKKHYGDKAYWVYIYLENQKLIPNPNKVGSNVRLKIPPLEKYATQSTEAQRKAAANQKAAEILAKYK